MADNNDNVTALENFIKSTIVDFINTAIDCEVVSYENGKVTVKPFGKKTYDDGDDNPYPTLHNIRMAWPQFAGGRAGVKGPVMAGDRGLLIVMQTPNDDSDDTRKYSLVDSYFIPGGGYDDAIPGNGDMRVYFGDSFISVSDDGPVMIKATEFIVDAPKTTINGETTMQGETTVSGNLNATTSSIGGISFVDHVHSNPEGGFTGKPQ